MQTDSPVLLDLDVPAVPLSGASGSFDWLSASVARFSRGEDHRRRRGLAVTLLRSAAPGCLQSAAARDTTRAINTAGTSPFDAMTRLARTVPVAALARALGRQTDPAAVDVIARSLRPGASPREEADVAVAIALGGRDPTELEAALIGVLVQTCDATAGLIGNALLAGHHDVMRVIAEDAPVRSTRRTDRTGEPVLVDLFALGLPFGAGTHACPGRDHALALASGVTSTLLQRCARTDDAVLFEDAPNLHMPARLMMTAR